MNSSRQWLIIFTAVLSVLVITTASLVFLTKGYEVALLPENTPQGTVQRYLIAIQERDYQAAYNYLSFDPSQKPLTYDKWLNMGTGNPQRPNQTTWKATLGKTTQNGDYATVEVIIDTLRPDGPFVNPLNSQQVAFQLHIINLKWLITSPTYVYWIY